MTLQPFDSTDLGDELDPLSQRLRAGAASAAPAPSPALRGRILAAVRAAPRIERASERRPRLLANVLAAAASVAALLSAYWLTRPEPPSASVAPDIASVTHELLGTRARVLAVPGGLERELRLEVERLWRDTSRLAESVARGLPATLRTPDESL